MSNLRPFQIVLLAFFGALAIGSLILLGAYQASVSENSRVYGDEVIIWGTFDEKVVEKLFGEITNDIKAFAVVEYREHDEDQFVDNLVNAIAENRGPDLIMMSSEDMVTLRTKLLPLPYETLPLRTFKDLYVDGTEIFAFPEGIYALPFAADPLMFYWNRDLYAASGIAQAPQTWEEVVNLLVPNVTEVDNRRTILQSALAFGEFRNLVNPKATLLALAMQSGSRMVYFDETKYEVALDRHIVADSKRKPFQLAMEFFTDFSNSNSRLYTWNRVQPNDKNAFLGGQLATYFGLASEYRNIAGKNPNLNFDVAMIPQGKSATIKRTFADFYGFAIPQTSFNRDGAFQAALTLTSAEYGGVFAEQLGMVSSRRDVLASGHPDPVVQAAMSSALVARSWLDPSPVATDAILQEMVEGVVSNRERINKAVSAAVGRIIREF